jgi:hypothetical protein
MESPYVVSYNLEKIGCCGRMRCGIGRYGQGGKNMRVGAD